jgi:alkylated DNA nucleotide flippase Atl1
MQSGMKKRHRVVNRQGEISFQPSPDFSLQRCFLEGEGEGVMFDKRGRADLAENLWWP